MRQSRKPVNQRLPLSLFVPRNNLSQWEKVIRGEESAVWISSQAVAPGTSEKLPVKIGD